MTPLSVGASCRFKAEVIPGSECCQILAILCIVHSTVCYTSGCLNAYLRDVLRYHTSRMPLWLTICAWEQLQIILLLVRSARSVKPNLAFLTFPKLCRFSDNVEAIYSSESMLLVVCLIVLFQRIQELLRRWLPVPFRVVFRPAPEIRTGILQRPLCLPAQLLVCSRGVAREI